MSVDLPYNLKAGVRVNGNIRGYKLERERPSGSINFRSNYRQDQSSLIDLTVQGRLTWGQSFFKDKLTVDAALLQKHVTIRTIIYMHTPIRIMICLWTITIIWLLHRVLLL